MNPSFLSLSPPSSSGDCDAYGNDNSSGKKKREKNASTVQVPSICSASLESEATHCGTLLSCATQTTRPLLFFLSCHCLTLGVHLLSVAFDTLKTKHDNGKKKKNSRRNSKKKRSQIEISKQTIDFQVKPPNNPVDVTHVRCEPSRVSVDKESPT